MTPSSSLKEALARLAKQVGVKMDVGAALLKSASSHQKETMVSGDGVKEKTTIPHIIPPPSKNNQIQITTNTLYSNKSAANNRNSPSKRKERNARKPKANTVSDGGIKKTGKGRTNQKKVAADSAPSLIESTEFNAELALRNQNNRTAAGDAGKTDGNGQKTKKPFEPRVVCKYWMEGLCTKVIILSTKNRLFVRATPVPSPMQSNLDERPWKHVHWIPVNTCWLDHVCAARSAGTLTTLAGFRVGFGLQLMWGLVHRGPLVVSPMILLLLERRP